MNKTGVCDKLPLDLSNSFKICSLIFKIKTGFTSPINLKISCWLGETCWVENEDQMHAVTAASGSSPAYFFLFMEAMQKALLDMDLDETTARHLVQQSALGAAKMVIENPKLDLATLRQNVTSKGGTTAAAIHIFHQHELMETVQQAMQACVTRSQEMETLF